MDEKLAASLRTFVSKGGTVIAEAPLATDDRWGGELPQGPGFGLEKVFGICQVRPAIVTSSNISTPNGNFSCQNPTDFVVTTGRIVGTYSDKRSAVVVNRFGKGTAIYIGAEVGTPNASHWGSNEAGLRTFIAASLKDYASLFPSIAVSCKSTATGFIDTSVRRDALGNRRIVLATPPDNAKRLPAATKVTLSLPSATAGQTAQAFLFPPECRSNGRVSAGPRRVSIGRISKSSATISLPDVAAALPVLIAQEFSPLVRIEAPEIATDGAEVTVNVTCFNPSSKPLRVTPSMVLPLGWKSITTPTAFVVPVRGERTVAIHTRSGGGERSVIKARLTYLTHGKTVSYADSIPVDIFAKSQ